MCHIAVINHLTSASPHGCEIGIEPINNNKNNNNNNNNKPTTRTQLYVATGGTLCVHTGGGKENSIE